MKFKKLLAPLAFLISVSFVAAPALSKDSKKMDHKGHDHKHEHKEGEKHDHSDQKAEITKVGKEKIQIKVAGMVCPFCAQGVEKGFKARKAEVKDVKVDMDTMMVEVHFKKGKSLGESTLKEIITDAGFAYGGVVE